MRARKRAKDVAKHRTRQGAAVAEGPLLEPRRTVARYSSPLEAHMVCALLEAEGIGCVLGNELFSAVDSPSLATGGVSVQVREADFERAIEILRAQEGEAQEEAEPPWARSRKKTSPRAWLAALLLVGILSGFLRSAYESLMTLLHSR